MTFEWDENKNKQNTKKHNISFEEAQYAFLDPKKIILEDKKHSIDEERFFVLDKLDLASLLSGLQYEMV